MVQEESKYMVKAYKRGWGDTRFTFQSCVFPICVECLSLYTELYDSLLSGGKEKIIQIFDRQEGEDKGMFKANYV